MSLRGFHIVFISLVTLFCAFVAVWAFTMSTERSDATVRVIGWICSVAAVATPIYGVYFLKKAKQFR